VHVKPRSRGSAEKVGAEQKYQYCSFGSFSCALDSFAFSIARHNVAEAGETGGESCTNVRSSDDPKLDQSRVYGIEFL
jgi:hypothetical protein